MAPELLLSVKIKFELNIPDRHELTFSDDTVTSYRLLARGKVSRLTLKVVRKSNYDVACASWVVTGEQYIAEHRDVRVHDPRHLSYAVSYSWHMLCYYYFLRCQRG